MAWHRRKRGGIKYRMVCDGIMRHSAAAQRQSCGGVSAPRRLRWRGGSPGGTARSTAARHRTLAATPHSYAACAAALPDQRVIRARHHPQAPHSSARSACLVRCCRSFSASTTRRLRHPLIACATRLYRTLLHRRLYRHSSTGALSKTRAASLCVSTNAACAQRGYALSACCAGAALLADAH